MFFFIPGNSRIILFRQQSSAFSYRAAAGHWNDHVGHEGQPENVHRQEDQALLQQQFWRQHFLFQKLHFITAYYKSKFLF